MMTQTDIYHWSEVDKSPLAEDFVNYLDMVTALKGTQERKHESYQVMGAKEGGSYLDLGCGTGDDAIELAKIAGPSGRVVGVDNSAVMISEAQQKAQKAGVDVEFYQGSGEALEFADNSFDACRADRVFQHLPDRKVVLAEMIRVTRSGGRVLINDPDYGGRMVDGYNRELTDKILTFMNNRVRNPWAGRQNYRLLKEAGLLEVASSPRLSASTNFERAKRLGRFPDAARIMQEQGVLTEEEANTWIADMERSAEAGYFFCVVASFMVCGVKP
ncbi:methyltransferase domain-containing protein [Porticoccus sp. W117]|uniref:methyltransferase domain-containing protein n=1 Tax=Porticoccus sp. W117 TaxID=3054777 RepID=UPI0025920EB7|nr:methyltransferase domain-containing protein [Porticoccus sp. W117]MDM3871036.1 methyltransferase domain-containing protein [Porticoccus sp. W117]